MNAEQKERAFATFLGIASRDLREGRFLHALVIFSSLAKIEFTRQRDAHHGEAVALARMGQFKEAFRDSKRMLEDIVSRHDEQTVYRANTLKSLAVVSIGLEDYEDIDEILGEAAEIYEHQGLSEANGAIVYLQGLVALWRGDFEEALEKFTWAATLSEFKIPEIVPFGIEVPTEPMATDRAEMVLAGNR